MVTANSSLYDASAPTVWLDRLRRSEPARLERLLVHAGSTPAWLSRHIPLMLTIAATAALDRGQPQEALARTQAPIHLFGRGRTPDDAFGYCAACGVAAVALATLGDVQEMQAMLAESLRGSQRAVPAGEPYTSKCTAVYALASCSARLALGQYSDAVAALAALPAQVPEIVRRDAARLTALAQCRSGDLLAAAASLRSALAADAAADDRAGVAVTQHALAELSFAHGDVGDTLAIGEGLLPLLRQLGYKRAEARLHALLAAACSQSQQWEAAGAFSECAAAIFAETGDRRDEAHASLQSAKARSATGADAAARFTRALSLSREIGYSNLEHQALCGLGSWALANRDFDAALWHLLQADQLAIRAGFDGERVLALVDIAHAIGRRRSPLLPQEISVLPVAVTEPAPAKVAEKILRFAVGLGAASGSPQGLRVAQVELARVLRAQGKATEAFDLLDEAFVCREQDWSAATLAQARRMAQQRRLTAVQAKAEASHAQSTALEAASADRVDLHQQMHLATEAAKAGSWAKSEFLAVLSHEIRTPLNAILGFADLLHGLPEPVEFAVALDAIERNGQFLLALFDDLLQFSHLEHGKLAIVPQPVTVLTVAREAVQAHLPAARRKGLRLEMTVVPPDAKHSPAQPDMQLAAMHTDPLRLWQVLGNLLGNAVKFTDAGCVTMAVRFDCEGSQPKVWYEISDTGPGIGAEHLQRIFEPFTQVDSSLSRVHGGAGLGLAIVKRLVEQLGGEIKVASTVGIGSWFAVCLPLAEPLLVPAENNVVPEGLSVHKPAHSWPLRVLLVDDDPVQRTIGKLVLTKFGYAPLLASDGLEALRTIAAGGIDCVLLDQQMPGMSGLHVAEELTRTDRGRPHVIGTTSLDPQLQGTLMPPGIDQWMAKPLTADGLILKLRAAYLDQGRRHDRPASENS